MRAVIVTGDRHANSTHWWPVLLPHLTEVDVVITGGATGIDAIAARICQDFIKTHLIDVPAQWNTHGKAAGPKRNAAMLSILLTLKDHGYTVGVLAFHDDLNGSKGTKQMVGIAKAAGVPVVLYGSDGSRTVQP